MGVRHIQTHDDGRAARSHAPLSAGSEPCGDRHVASASNEMPEAVFVPQLGVGRGRHGPIIGPFITRLTSSRSEREV